MDDIIKRLDAIVSRLDEQDATNDAILAKLDRTSVLAAQAAQASEQALTALIGLGRRVSILEHGQ